MPKKITSVLTALALLICLGFADAAAPGSIQADAAVRRTVQAQSVAETEETLTEVPGAPAEAEESLTETQTEAETEKKGFLETARERLGDAARKAKDAAEKAAGKVKETAGSAKDKAEELLAAAGDAIGGAAGAVMDAAGKAAETVGEAAGKAADTVGEAAGSVVDAAGETAGSIRDKALELSEEVSEEAEQIGDTLSKIAEKWRRVAEYVRTRLSHTNITAGEWDILERKYTKLVKNMYNQGWIGKGKSFVLVSTEADFLFKSCKYAYQLGKDDISISEYILYMLKLVNKDGLPFGLATLAGKITGLDADEIIQGAGVFAEIFAEEIQKEENTAGTQALP